MFRQSASDQEIQKWIWQQHHLWVAVGWIADCKQECGIRVDDVRAFQQARFSPCPPEIRPAVKQAFRYFGMLPPEP